MEEIIFKTEQVVKRYKGFRAMLKKGKNAANALDGLDMEIRRGEIYGFVGKNGAGKTTLLRVIAGAVLLTGGTMELFGERDPEKMHLQRRIAFFRQMPVRRSVRRYLCSMREL